MTVYKFTRCSKNIPYACKDNWIIDIYKSVLPKNKL